MISYHFMYFEADMYQGISLCNRMEWANKQDLLEAEYADPVQQFSFSFSPVTPS